MESNLISACTNAIKELALKYNEHQGHELINLQKSTDSLNECHELSRTTVRHIHQYFLF